MLKHRKTYGSSANSFSRSETSKNGILYNIRCRSTTMGGDSYVSNLAGLISHELNKMQGCPTTGFVGNDLNCVVG